MKQAAEQELSVWLMKAVYSEGRATVGSAVFPGRMAFDQTLSTPDIYTPHALPRVIKQVHRRCPHMRGRGDV